MTRDQEHDGPEVDAATPGHVDLLAAAARLRQAAVSDDAATLQRELSRLRSDLARHVDAEDRAVQALPGAAALIVRDGQQRLLRLLGDTLSDVGPDCACILRAAEIEVTLRRQAQIERSLFERHLPR